MIPAGYPLPERPANLEEALARGYDPHAPTFDHVPPEPLSDEWIAMLDAAIEQAKHLRCDVVDCGNRRCDSCDERMTCVGPAPRACGVTCWDCPCDCTSCLQVQQEMRAELVAQIAKEERL